MIVKSQEAVMADVRDGMSLSPDRGRGRSAERTAHKEMKRRRRGRNSDNQLGSGDFVLTALVLGLTVFGIIMVFSASYYTAINSDGSPYNFLIRQTIYAVGGGIACLFFAVIDYHFLAKFSTTFYVVTVAMIAMTYTGLGATYNKAARWIALGPITIIPGEIAKLSCILLCAWWISNKKHSDLDPVNSLLPLLVMIAVPAALVYFQPSTTTAATILIIATGILFVAGIRLIYLAAAGVLGVAVLLIHVLQSGNSSYRALRLTSFLDPFADEQGSGYQVVQGLYALASGGLKGLGIGKSVQKTLYLPDPQNDFIFAIIGEELGYIGLLVLLAAYMFLIWRCVRIALRTPDLLGLLIASGITIMLAVQVLMNIMVVTSLMPPTGVTLPFVSFGGTAILLFLSSMGIMINISRHESKPGKKTRDHGRTV